MNDIIFDDGKGFKVQRFNNAERGRCYRIINNRGPRDFSYVEVSAEQFQNMALAGYARFEKDGAL